MAEQDSPRQGLLPGTGPSDLCVACPMQGRLRLGPIWELRMHGPGLSRDFPSVPSKGLWSRLQQTPRWAVSPVGGLRSPWVPTRHLLGLCSLRCLSRRQPVRCSGRCRAAEALGTRTTPPPTSAGALPLGPSHTDHPESAQAPGPGLRPTSRPHLGCPSQAREPALPATQRYAGCPTPSGSTICYDSSWNSEKRFTYISQLTLRVGQRTQVSAG